MKRSDWIIAGFLAVLFLMVLAGGLIFWLQSQAHQNAAALEPVASFGSGQMADGGITAGNAIQMGWSVAQEQWQADALAVSASATIVRFETVEDLYGGRASWTVVYYSPIASSIATYIVRDGQVNFLSAKQVENPPATFDAQFMSLDSGQAFSLALANGGEELFQGQAQRVATLKVEQNPQSGRLEWLIAIQNETSGAHKSFSIDALTGEILSQS